MSSFFMMKSLLFSFLFLLFSFFNSSYAQNTLPDITLINSNGKTIVSWLNDYKKPVTNILIQRSYDSLKNFSSIGSVLNPLNLENGYLDAAPPYDKMYYRINISFEGGGYIIGPSSRPTKEKSPQEMYNDSMRLNNPLITREDSLLYYKYSQHEINTINPWLYRNELDSNIKIPAKNNNENTYPSNRIFTNRDNNVILYLPEASIKKYAVKFYDDKGVVIFELPALTEEYLILEPYNFRHSGWFIFEIFENKKIIERNKFFLSNNTDK